MYFFATYTRIDITFSIFVFHLFVLNYSEWGAIQLLTDFNAVPTWLERNTFIGEELQEFLISDEILRRCTGVGHLLLRKPGELLSMTAGGGGESVSYTNKIINMYLLLAAIHELMKDNIIFV